MGMSLQGYSLLTWLPSSLFVSVYISIFSQNHWVSWNQTCECSLDVTLVKCVVFFVDRNYTKETGGSKMSRRVLSVLNLYLWNKTWYGCSLGGSLKRLFLLMFVRSTQNKQAQMCWKECRQFWIFISETTETIGTLLGRNVHWMVL